MEPILQKSLPFRANVDGKLPGVGPLALGDWLIVDDAYAGQMALRAKLIKDAPEAVLAQSPNDTEALAELLSMVVEQLQLRDDFAVNGDLIICPDGRQVRLDAACPLQSLNALVQEDFCLMTKPAGAAEHQLTSAILCFPANWYLSQKIGRGLIGIHDPVDPYDENIAARVQRLFDGVRAGIGLWRNNILWYNAPELHQPAKSHVQRNQGFNKTAPFMRIERQSILRLPKTGAVVFSIHTFVLARADAEKAGYASFGLK